MRILVIEDNHRLSSSLAANLAHEGYSVDAAYDGQEGQDLAELTPYAVQLRYDFEFWPDRETIEQALNIAERVRAAVLATVPQETHP